VKFALWLLVFTGIVLGLVFPLTYLYVASQLPPLEGEFDLETHLRHTIEGERISHMRALPDYKPEHVTYQKPDFTQLPTELVALYLSQRGCPTYFQTPREEGFRWGYRMFVGLLLNGKPEGDGYCERLFSLRLAEEIGVKGDMPLSIAAHKIHGFLQKDELIAYHLSSLVFDRGLVGVEAVVKELYGRKPGELDLAELAELMLTLPPNHLYVEIKQCKNPPLIRAARDSLLKDLLEDKLIEQGQYDLARTREVACRIDPPPPPPR
jgi:hypothetical protein